MRLNSRYNKGINMYVVEMLRFGERELNSYVVGVFDTLEQAEEVGKAEQHWLGGIYKYVVSEFKTNSFSERKLALYKTSLTNRLQ